MPHYGDYSFNKKVFTEHGLGRIEAIKPCPSGMINFIVNVKGVSYTLPYNKINIEDIFKMNVAVNESIPIGVKQILKFKCKDDNVKSKAQYEAKHIRELCDAVLINVDEDVIRTVSYMKRIAETIKNVEVSYLFKKTYTPIDAECAIQNVFRNRIDEKGSYNFTITCAKKLIHCLENIGDDQLVSIDLDVYEYISKWAKGEKSLTSYYCNSLRFFSYDMWSSRELDQEKYDKIMDEI